MKKIWKKAHELGYGKYFVKEDGGETVDDHIYSQISNRYIKHPSEVLKVGQIVTVWVLSVDTAKKRISLTMKKPE